ncbi:E3 ubiquitin-protein ligase MIB2-like [Anneissia japonica]|uniref:E3 ubiquitin-protein ligase MIB2-like n=1 Tax=Anneissia japonica TaxID=1529436 RepID=UPI0014258BD1|nr:E3 ubiquitin-protein ligase MIB2-like [Anneissia japonica]
MSVGTRVVRSGNWSQGQVDGGEGHMGTIFQPENKPPLSDKCHVVWDNGNTTVCKIGIDGELLIYDNAPTGASHPNVKCDSCNKEAFLGVRWKCNECYNYDLCNSCYMSQKHDLDHQFLRITHEGGQRVPVEKRHGSVMLQAWGISKGAEVTRGIHWKWEDQDGGNGKTGIVKSIANWNKSSWRSGAKVEWKNGSVKGYRIGFEGQVDLKYVKEHKSEQYYRSHLAHVEAASDRGKASKVTEKPSYELKKGDKVSVRSVSMDLFELMQADYGGFSEDLAKVIGKTGTVEEVLTFKNEMFPRIKFDDNVYTINPKLLDKVQPNVDRPSDDFLQKISNIKDKNEKPPTTNDITSPNRPQPTPGKIGISFKVGDTVRVKWIEESQYKELQSKHGGFVDKMLSVRCKTGRIEAILNGRTPRVRFDANTVWNINPECLELTDEGEDFVQTISQRPDEKKNTTKPSGPIIKTTKFASGDKVCVKNIEEFQMAEMQKGFSEFDSEMKAVCGKTGTVLDVDDETKAVTVSVGGRSWKFNPQCIGLVEQGPKSKRIHGTLSSTSSNQKTDDGPLRAGDIVKVKDMTIDKMISLQNGHGGFALEMTQTIGKTGQVMKVDSDGDVLVNFTIHRPFYYNPACLELQSRSDGTSPRTGPNIEDALFQLLLGGQSTDFVLVKAAQNGDLSTVDRCIRSNPSSVDIMVQNVTAIMAACAKGHKAVVERLLQAGSDMEKRDKDGWTAVFFAVYGNSSAVVELLLSKRCNVNARSNNGNTCLHIASRRGYERCVAVLLSTRYNCDPNIKDNDGDTALHEATSNKHGSVTTLLVQHPNINLLLNNGKGMNAFHLAAAHDDVVSLQKMVQKNSNVMNSRKSDGLTALHLAAMNDSPNAVKYFISTPMCNKNIQDGRGSTPLHCAVGKGHNQVIELLVKGGANMDVQDNDGDTSLHLSMMTSELTSLPPELLLLGALAGAGLGGTSRKGVAIACFLVVNGANLNIRNKRGKTPLDLAGNQEVRNKLRAAQLQRQIHGRLF